MEEKQPHIFVSELAYKLPPTNSYESVWINGSRLKLKDLQTGLIFESTFLGYLPNRYTCSGIYFDPVDGTHYYKDKEGAVHNLTSSPNYKLESKYGES